MTATPFSVRVRHAVVEQTERTRRSSKADIDPVDSTGLSKNQNRGLFRLMNCGNASALCLLRLEADRQQHPETLDSKYSGARSREYLDKLGRGLRRWIAELTGALSAAARSHHLLSFMGRGPADRTAMAFFRSQTKITTLARSKVAQCNLESFEELSLDIPSVDPGTVLSFTVPRLRKLDLRSDSDPLPILIMPWAQLADFTFNCSSDCSQPDIAFNVLAQCPNLSLASVCTGPLSPRAGKHTLVLSHLRALSVHFSRPAGHAASNGASFWDNLSAPVLEEVCLHFGHLTPVSHFTPGTEVHWTEAHFPAFQLRTPNLTALELDSSKLTSDDLMTVLHHTPCLERLTLRYCWHCFDDAFIGALYYQDGVQPLVPHLHSLDLEDITTNKESADIFASMLASRWWTDAEATLHLIPPAVTRWTRVGYRSFGRRRSQTGLWVLMRDLERKVWLLILIAMIYFHTLFLKERVLARRMCLFINSQRLRFSKKRQIVGNLLNPFTAEDIPSHRRPSFFQSLYLFQQFMPISPPISKSIFAVSFTNSPTSVGENTNYETSPPPPPLAPASIGLDCSRAVGIGRVQGQNGLSIPLNLAEPATISTYLARQFIAISPRNRQSRLAFHSFIMHSASWREHVRSMRTDHAARREKRAVFLVRGAVFYIHFSGGQRRQRAPPAGADRRPPEVKARLANGLPADCTSAKRRTPFIHLRRSAHWLASMYRLLMARKTDGDSAQRVRLGVASLSEGGWERGSWDSDSDGVNPRRSWSGEARLGCPATVSRVGG
ncbi:hypothetical protein B0H14DRAFT_3566524 [Mycena olivaceomarginata]|nr:hypothetical protein B0H14DRAFT_3566524 [Mycena olivaceomarginata]